MSALAQEIRDAVRAVLDERGIPEHREVRLLKFPEAANYISQSLRTVEEMVARQELPSVRNGRARMIDVRDLDRWIDEHKDRANG